jgi:hypothetical protein
MSTTGRSDGTADDIATLAGALASAGFVRVLTRADGDGLAAAGVLGRALSALDTPFQVGVAPTAAGRRRRAAGPAAPGTDALTVLIGETPGSDTEVVPETDRPASASAAAITRELGVDDDGPLARAGAIAAGVSPASIPELDRQGTERRPGVAVPTTDLADGLTHSTLVHAPFSGDETAAGALLSELGLPADLDDGARRRVASAVAIAATDHEPAERYGRDVERLLRPRPTPDGPFETLGGYADVLAATAAVAPGTGVALALGHDVRSAALSAWREHGRAVHATLRDVRTSRYDGALVAQTAGTPPVRVTAELLLATRSPEPTALVLGIGEAGVAAAPEIDVRAAIRSAAAAVDGEADAAADGGYLRYDAETDVTQLLAAFREAL